jgi:hypothetical protein
MFLSGSKYNGPALFPRNHRGSRVPNHRARRPHPRRHLPLAHPHEGREKGGRAEIFLENPTQLSNISALTPSTVVESLQIATDGATQTERLPSTANVVLSGVDPASYAASS